ncbi:MAG TPA: SGNH hydrolase domain-containing protein [Clostridia bacterium]|nr:SGNH hydrolase domain-containing protein [Clostridia bacterium]
MTRRTAVVPLVLIAILLAVSPAYAAAPDPADDPTHVSLPDLQPRVGAAGGDLGRPYADGCHVAHDVTSPTHCPYGDRLGTKIVVVVGDSIAAQWWASIHGAGRKGGWRVVWMSKTSCPAADVTVLSRGSAYTACNTWRRNVLAKVRNLSRVDLLVMSGSSEPTLLSRTDGSPITDPSLRAAEWQAGYQRTVDAVAGQVRRVVILRDTPTFTFRVPDCLKAHSGWTKPCSRLRTYALSASYWRAEQAVDARYAWVRATDMANWICQTTRCWPVTSDRILRYRDGHHLTNTFARALAPAMYSRLRWLML